MCAKHRPGIDHAMCLVRAVRCSALCVLMSFHKALRLHYSIHCAMTARAAPSASANTSVGVHVMSSCPLHPVPIRRGGLQVSGSIVFPDVKIISMHHAHDRSEANPLARLPSAVTTRVRCDYTTQSTRAAFPALLFEASTFRHPQKGARAHCRYPKRLSRATRTLRCVALHAHRA